MLAIAIIEAVTGQPLNEVYRSMLPEPLGIGQTWFPGFDRPSPTTADPMALRARGEPIEFPLLMESIRRIFSSAADF